MSEQCCCSASVRQSVLASYSCLGTDEQTWSHTRTNAPVANHRCRRKLTSNSKACGTVRVPDLLNFKGKNSLLKLLLLRPLQAAELTWASLRWQCNTQHRKTYSLRRCQPHRLTAGGKALHPCQKYLSPETEPLHPYNRKWSPAATSWHVTSLIADVHWQELPCCLQKSGSTSLHVQGGLRLGLLASKQRRYITRRTGSRGSGQRCRQALPPGTSWFPLARPPTRCSSSPVLPGRCHSL